MTETVEQFTLRANSPLLQTAIRLSIEESGDHTPFEPCMGPGQGEAHDPGWKGWTIR
jgi:hypothetical protein